MCHTMQENWGAGAKGEVLGNQAGVKLNSLVVGSVWHQQRLHLWCNLWSVEKIRACSLTMNLLLLLTTVFT